MPCIECYCNFCINFFGYFLLLGRIFFFYIAIVLSFVLQRVFFLFSFFVLWIFEISSQKRTERRDTALSVPFKKIVLICSNIIILRHLNKRRVNILCCSLKYHFSPWCCDCHSCWCLGLFSVNVVVAAGYTGSGFGLCLGWLGCYRDFDTLQKKKTKKTNKGITCKIADISSWTSQVRRWTNLLLFRSLAALTIFYYICLWFDEASWIWPPSSQANILLLQPRRKVQLL